MAYKKLSNCKYCEMAFEGLSTSQRANHSRWCHLNPKSEEYKQKSMKAIAAMHKSKKDSGNTNQFTKAKNLGLPIPENPLKGRKVEGRPHTEETKQKLREKALASSHRRLKRKTIMYNGVLLDSSWELELAKRLDSIGVKWVRPDPIKWTDLEGVEHHYFPDFYLPDQKIYLDPKNSFAYETQKEKWKVLLSERDDIIILSSLEECLNFSI